MAAIVLARRAKARVSRAYSWVAGICARVATASGNNLQKTNRLCTIEAAALPARTKCRKNERRCPISMQGGVTQAICGAFRLGMAIAFQAARPVRRNP
jgi:hypothetical protein